MDSEQRWGEEFALPMAARVRRCAEVVLWYWRQGMAPAEAAFASEAEICGSGVMQDISGGGRHRAILAFEFPVSQNITSSPPVFWSCPLALVIPDFGFAAAHLALVIQAAAPARPGGPWITSEPDGEGRRWLGAGPPP